jgi:phosphatidylinositol glycan class K
MIDTCQANTMYSKFYSPNIVATGSSQLGENSYSVSRQAVTTPQSLIVTFQHENDHDIGVAVIDSYTHYVLQYLEQINKTSKATMADLVRFRSVSAPKTSLT